MNNRPINTADHRKGTATEYLLRNLISRLGMYDSKIFADAKSDSC